MFMKRRIIIDYIPHHYLSFLEIEKLVKEILEENFNSQGIVTNVKIEEIKEPEANKNKEKK